jgi:hypothetical protein
MSEQRYWADLRTEAENILRKVEYSLTQGSSGGNARDFELTPAEGRRLEKWLDATTTAVSTARSQNAGNDGWVPAHGADGTGAAAVHSSQGSQRPANTIASGSVAPASRPININESYGAGERELRDDTTAESDHQPSATARAPPAPLPLPPLPVEYRQPPAAMDRATPAVAHRAVERDETAVGREPPHTAYTTHHSDAPRPRSGEKYHPVRKFTGLREENNRDVFLKSLRSDIPGTASKTPQSNARAQQSADAARTPLVAAVRPRGRSLQDARAPSARVETSTAAQVRAPPPLPGHIQHPGPPTVLRTTNVEREPPPLPVQLQSHSHPSSAARASGESNLSSVSNGSTVRQPPPLPVQVQHQLSTGRVDLSIFKRAGSDPVYQGEVRRDIGQKKQHRAELTGERLGFLSGGQRRLKF